ncbi:MAG: hypothetical protein CVU56_20565 [Deltaproteobacteria bacterium HGW-Deltaproteobacteria-14]|nr:MAG: hypothetical protein CVU56_20565 [Deltaproteobacteria bacterium HGW-Deltaproteobacteria-14]
MCSAFAFALAVGAACGGDSGGTTSPNDYPAQCSDSAKSAGESDVDCGGPCAPCRNGLSCVNPPDCASQYCGAGYLCWPAQCGDGNQGLTETGVDCGGSCPACLGDACAQNSGCVTGFCDGDVCGTPTCDDGQKNGKETGVDCGGGVCGACADGQTCLIHPNCVSGFCNPAGLCAAPSCTDAVKNQNETDVDCGGDCGPCADGQTCLQPIDCQSTKCSNGTCGALGASCANGQKDDDESDVDCGGACGPCGYDRSCGGPADCRSGLCDSGRCTAPVSCSDAALSPGESDVDCGGNDCPQCAEGKTCRSPLDCFTLACHDGLCSQPSCDDAYKNGLETDVDCGGGACPSCADSLRCKFPSDCQGGSCTGGFCGSCTDGVKNGDESDVDCGGDTCGPCALGKSCSDGADCQTTACGADSLCCTPNACGFCGDLTAEICNGVDDDCDGQTDDGLAAQACANQQGVCAGANATCGGTAGWQCGADVLLAHAPRYQSNEATCDKLDNDCDGQTDEPGCGDCSVAQDDQKAFASGAGEVRFGADFVTVHQGKPVMAFTKLGNRPNLIVASRGGYDLRFTDLDGEPAIASDGATLFVSYVEDLNNGSIRSLFVRKLVSGIDYHTLLQTSDVPALAFPIALSVGGGHAALLYVNGGQKLMLGVSANTNFGTSWDHTELDTKRDPQAQVVVSTAGVVHAVWRTNQGAGELQHWTAGAKVPLGGNASDVALAVAPDGALHLALRDGTTVKHRVFAGGAWATATTVGTTDAGSDVAVAVDPGGVPYVAFRASVDKVKVMRGGAGAWAEVVTRTVTDPANTISEVQGIGLAVDAKGVVQIGAGSYDASLAGWRYASFLTGCQGYGDATTCTPSCAGKQCGDNGCGGTCGTCSGTTSCNAAGQCVGGCTPSCAGKQCGDNGCGGTCGTCTGATTCNPSGQCVASAGQCGGDSLNTCLGRCGLFNEAWTCQCDAQCATTGDCCPDLGTCCTATTCGAAGNSSCNGQCGAFSDTRACNCDTECADYYDCCPDIVPCCAQ